MENVRIVHKQSKKIYQISIDNKGSENKSTCPICSESRTKKTEKCLSFNIQKKTGKCNHCSEIFYLKENIENVDIYKSIKKYTKPTFNNLPISQSIIDWFKNKRHISVDTLNYFKISTDCEYMPQIKDKVNCILFPYYINNEIVNIKYRDHKKNFKLSKDCELVFYNIDSVEMYDSVYVTEGEIDAMSLHEAGYKNVISVPNGATTGNINFDYLENCVTKLQDKSKFILCFDSDTAGVNLRNAFAKRMGEYRCVYIDFKEFKDANEVLCQFGASTLQSVLRDEVKFKISGVFSVNDIDAEINDYYENGLPKGAKIGDHGFDKLLDFHKGYMTLITGIPGSGKSEFLDYIICKLACFSNWKFGLYSPENHPLQLHFSKFAEKLLGKPFDGIGRMSRLELDQSKLFANDKFYFIKPKEDFTLDNILSTIDNLIMAYGIECFVIDAWNKIEHNYNGSETQYISKQLDKIVNFAEQRNVHVFVVAHPIKMPKDKDGNYEVPTLYNISGSANFFNKTANGITVHRNYELNVVDVFVQKVKFKHWGKTGFVTYNWDYKSGRYFEGMPDNRSWITKTDDNFKIDYISGEVHVNNSEVHTKSLLDFDNFNDIKF
jgi:twinkle protein